MEKKTWKKRLNRFALLCLLAAVVIFVIDYFFFHYLTQAGFTSIKQLEAGKPLITALIGVLGTSFFFLSAASALAAGIFF